MIRVIDAAYLAANPTMVRRNLKVPWTPLAWSRLKALIKRMTEMGWSEEQWYECVSNRFASDGIKLGELPEVFIPYLHQYISGPMRKEIVHGWDPNASARTNRNRQAGEQADRAIEAAFARTSQGNP
jgi:hypothetical protein